MENSFERKEVPQIRLVEPTAEVKDSYLEAVREFGDANEWSEERVKNIENDPAGWIAKLNERASRKNMPEGGVPENTFWMLDGDRYIGSVRIRPEMNDRLKKIGGNIGYAIRPSERRKGHATEMLKMALQKAVDLGLSEAILTCDEDNIGSRKVIESNGGELLESNMKIDEWPVPIRRYKIALKPEAER